MKKNNLSLLPIFLILTLAFSTCFNNNDSSKSQTESTLLRLIASQGSQGSQENKEIVEVLFSAMMASYSSSSGMHDIVMNNSTQPIKASTLINIPIPNYALINIPIDDTYNSPLGGYILLTGSVTGTMNFDVDTGAFRGGFISIGITESIQDYKISNTLTINGAPHVSMVGTFTLNSDFSFGTASSIEIDGGYIVSGSPLCLIDVTININSSGTGGDFGGIACGRPISGSF